LKLGEKLNEKLNLDYNKPLFIQIFNAEFTFEEYVTFINEPKHLVNPVRDIILFDNWFLETVSRAKWWHIIVAYLPWHLYCIYWMAQVNFSLNPLSVLFVTFLGALSWTLTEYIVHRYLFHGEDYWMPYMPHNRWVFTAHFTIHGIHHAFPQDRERIVFPPFPGQLFLFYPLIFAPLKSCMPQEYFYNFFIGVLLGYQAYEMVHYSVHHLNPDEGWLRNMKLYHMQHHYKFGTIGFGVSSKFWDVVFGTDIQVDEA